MEAELSCVLVFTPYPTRTHSSRPFILISWKKQKARQECQAEEE
jgi:hypothetical protein